MKSIIPNKVKFVNDLNKVIPIYKTGIKKIEYRVFKCNHHTEEFGDQVYYQEYLVVTYDGGAIGVRSCNCDSFRSPRFSKSWLKCWTADITTKFKTYAITKTTKCGKKRV